MKQKQDICNVQGYEAECLLDFMNVMRNMLNQPLPEIMRENFESDINTWQMVLEMSGHLVHQSENGYDFQRRHTGPLSITDLPEELRG